MNDTIKTIVTSAIVAIVVAGGIWLTLPAKTPIVGADAVFGNTSVDGSQSNLPNPSNTDYDVARLALGLGTNLSNSNTGAGNVNIEAQRMNLNVATITPCAIQNPFNATSSLVDATFNVTTGTSSAAQIVFATSTTAFATTSALATMQVAASSDGTFVTGETATSTGIGVVLGPSNWLVIGTALGSAVGYGYTYGGTCSAVFQSV